MTRACCVGQYVTPKFWLHLTLVADKENNPHSPLVNVQRSTLRQSQYTKVDKTPLNP